VTPMSSSSVLTPIESALANEGRCIFRKQRPPAAMRLDIESHDLSAGAKPKGRNGDRAATKDRHIRFALTRN
jgi:hypothetical protein